MSASNNPWGITCCDEYPETGGNVMSRAFSPDTMKGAMEINDLRAISWSRCNRGNRCTEWKHYSISTHVYAGLSPLLVANVDNRRAMLQLAGAAGMSTSTPHSPATAASRFLHRERESNTMRVSHYSHHTSSIPLHFCPTNFIPKSQLPRFLRCRPWVRGT